LPLPVADDEAFFERFRISLEALPIHSACRSRWIPALRPWRFRRATPRRGAWLALACGLGAAVVVVVQVSGPSSPSTSAATFARADGWAVSARQVSAGGFTVVAARYRPGTLSYAGRHLSVRGIMRVRAMRPGEILVAVSLRNRDALDQ